MRVPGEKASYEFGGFRLDPGRRQLFGPDDEAVFVRTKVFDILCLLVERAGQLVTKAELMDAIWPKLVVEENNLNQAISALRQCLGDDRQTPRFIATLTGRGYQFVAPVRRVSATDAAAAAPAPAAAPTSAAAPTPAAGRTPPPAAPTGSGTAPAVSRRRSLPESWLRLLPAIVVLATIAAVALWRPDADADRSGAAADTAVPGALRLTAARLATDFPDAHAEPTLSPDGTMMAFVGEADGVDQIWILNLVRGEPVQITSGDAPATAPSWSPRNDQILFQRPSANGVPGIWSIDPLGATEPYRVVEVGATPAFGAGGEQFVYAVGRSLWIANSDGSGSRRIDGVPGGPGFEARRSPALSPDGQTIAFVHAEAGPAGNVWLVPAAPGGQARPLTAAADGELGALALDPVFSADGRHVIYAAAAGAITNMHLWRVPVEGGAPEQLTSGVGGYGQPDVAANGTRLAYTNQRAGYRLIVTEPETAAHTVIHESRGPIILPAVAPDGREIVFFSGSTAGTQLYTIAADGSGRRQRTFDDGVANTLPVYSSDGVAILYYRDRTLHRLSRADDRNEQVLADFHWSSRHWLVTHGNRIAYRERSTVPAERRTVVHELDSGAVHAFPLTFSPTAWSRDGATLLGFSQEPGSAGQIYLCAVATRDCSMLTGPAGPILGNEPHWSLDETRIFFRRTAEQREFSALWVVDSTGGEPRRLFDFGPFDTNISDSNFGVVTGDSIVWNQFDPAGGAEIWVAGIGG